jgi:hypothetical protein
MRWLLVIAAVTANVSAAPVARSPKLGPLELYRAARAECRAPGPRIAQFMHGYFEHWLEPVAFGARVVSEWSSLTSDQRAAFAHAADAKLLAPERARRIAALCDPRDEYRSFANNKIVVRHHIADDELSIIYVMVERDGSWTLDRVDVPAVDYPGIDDDPIRKETRRQLDTYEHAMQYLRS